MYIDTDLLAVILGVKLASGESSYLSMINIGFKFSLEEGKVLTSKSMNHPNSVFVDEVDSHLACVDEQ